MKSISGVIVQNQREERDVQVLKKGDWPKWEGTRKGYLIKYKTCYEPNKLKRQCNICYITTKFTNNAVI